METVAALERNISVDKQKLIGWMISIGIPVLLSFVGISENFSPELKLFFMITIFVILIIAFELLPIMISAILLPTLYLMSGLVPAATAFGSWTSTTVWMVMGGLIFSNLLDDCGLLKRIAYYVISKCGGTYAGVVYGCFFIGIVLNLITFCYGWLVASALVFGVCKAMDMKPSRESSLICFAGTIGATGTTIFLYYPAYFAMVETAVREFDPDFSMTLGKAIVYNGFFVIWCVITLMILMKVYNTKQMETKFGKDLFVRKYEALGPMSGKEKNAIIMVLLLLGYLFSTNFTGLPAAYGFMTIPFMMFLPGIEVGDGEVLGRLNFSMVFFVATCLGIGVVGNAVGFGAFLTEIAVPVLTGKSPLFISIAFMLFGTMANFFMTPFAMLGGLALPFAQIAVTLGMNPIAVIMILVYSCELLILPYQSAGNLIMYSYGMMPMKDFIKQEGLKSLIMFVGFIVVMYPLWNLLGLM